ncbi:MAG: hypothetical protein QM764_10070 [Chitinophagaceae bacterium]
MKPRRNAQLSIESYKNFINGYLDARPGICKMIDRLYFDDAISVFEWIKSVEGKIIYYFTSTIRSKIPPAVVTLERIASAEPAAGFISQDFSDPYLFFSRIFFESFEEAENRFPSPYFVYDKDFFSRINSRIFFALNGYEQAKLPMIFYQRKISDSVILKIIKTGRYTKHSFLSEYTFPDLILERNGEDYYLFRSCDVNSFLLMPENPFVFFYLEASIPVWENDRVVRMDRRKDEPIIYEDKDSKRFIVSNSYEKLMLYNKYILICISLYVDIVKAFETWISKEPEASTEHFFTKI